VIDASVAIKWYVPEAGRDQAIKLLRLVKSGQMEFHVPDLMYCEAGNILWKRVRLGELSSPEAAEIASALIRVPKTVHSSVMLLPSALKMACLSGRSACDCFYLALAEFLDSAMITADTKLFHALAATPWKRIVVHVQNL
jgi:predicted nucleic acid-binding protein